MNLRVRLLDVILQVSRSVWTVELLPDCPVLSAENEM